MKKTLFGIFVILLFSSCSQKNKSLIVQENKLPGTSDWLIEVEFDSCVYPELQYGRRMQIEGYCSHTSVRTGDTITFHISTKPASEYKIDIYRLGYYQGKGGNLKKTIGPLHGNEQMTPEPDSISNFVECGWDEAYQLVIPEEWVSGVYLCKMTTAPVKYQAYMIFIVKDDRVADFIFQCSDLTWQSYNKWPAWHSLYDEAHIPWKGASSTTLTKSSFNRPYSIFVNALPTRRIGRRYGFDPLTNGSGEFLLWEYPLSYWMEQKGMDVTYVSNIDVHINDQELLRAKAFLSVGHDEYWTVPIFDNVCKARDAGVDILFIGGNTISGTFYLDPATDGALYRSIGRIPRSAEGPRVVAREIMGVTSHGVGFGSFKCQEPDHWMFKGTGLAKGDSITNMIGWETNGKPVGEKEDLIILAETIPIGSSGRFRDSTRSQLTTIYTAEKGNFVFQAGTCFWPLFLARTPAYQEPVVKPWTDVSKPDPRVQRMTLNLLKKALTN